MNRLFENCRENVLHEIVRREMDDDLMTSTQILKNYSSYDAKEIESLVKIAIKIYDWLDDETIRFESVVFAALQVMCDGLKTNHVVISKNEKVEWTLPCIRKVSEFGLNQHSVYEAYKKIKTKKTGFLNLIEKEPSERRRRRREEEEEEDGRKKRKKIKFDIQKRI